MHNVLSAPAVANLSMKAEIEALKEEIGELDQVARAQRAELEAKLARRRELQEVWPAERHLCLFLRKAKLLRSP